MGLLDRLKSAAAKVKHFTRKILRLKKKTPLSSKLSIHIPNNGESDLRPTTRTVQRTPKLLQMTQKELTAVHESEKKALEEYREAVKEVKELESQYKAARGTVQQRISLGRKSSAQHSLATMKSVQGKLQTLYPKLLTAREQSLAVRSVLESRPARSHREPVNLSGEPAKWTVPQLDYFSGPRLNRHLEHRVKTMQTARNTRTASRTRRNRK
jgi:hypothetical protein